MATVLQFGLFILASLASFMIPGQLLLEKARLKLNFWEKLFFSTTFGLVIFSLAAYLLLVLNIPFLLFPLILILNAIFFKKHFPFKKIPPFGFSAVLFLVFFLGILGQMAVIAPSGRIAGGELLFWSAHGHDGPWHIALMNEINKGWPLENPVYAGEKLVNYHFFSDVAPAFFQKHLGFSPLDLYFRFFPFLYSVLLGTTAFFLGKRLGKSDLAGIWSAIFVYFAGSWGFAVTLLQGKGIGGESIFWATQIQSSIGNPPQIISNILVLSFLYFFSILVEKKNSFLFLICTAIAGSLAVFKIYAAVVVLVSLAVVAVWQIARERGFYFFGLLISSSLLAAVLYLPNSAATASFLIFQPWWYIRTMVVEPSRLNWLDLELRRQFYLARGGWRSVLRILSYESSAFAIFFFGNLGLRAIGLVDFFKMLNDFPKNYFKQIFVSTIALSLILPLLFLQKGVASNTSQFLQYFILLFGILSALTVTKIMRGLKSGLVKAVLSLVIIFLAVPTQLGLLYDFYSRPAFAKINQEELSALNKIKEGYPEDAVVLTPAYNKYTDLKTTVPDIWDWFDTAYVSAFSSKRTYLADTEQVDIMGYDYKKRLAFQEKIFSEPSAGVVAKEMKARGLTILYFPKALAPKADFDEKYFERVIENRRVEVWAVK